MSVAPMLDLDRLSARLFRGLGDPSRLALLEALRAGEANVGDLVARTGLSQPSVSTHLACLLGCGLVTREQRGRFAFYGLSDPGVADLLTLARRLLVTVATGVADCDQPPMHGAGCGCPNDAPIGTFRMGRTR
jgi:DNA-binding transcriptional ArsR family regulator